jgi:hypothetical protein
MKQPQKNHPQFLLKFTPERAVFECWPDADDALSNKDVVVAMQAYINFWILENKGERLADIVDLAKASPVTKIFEEDIPSNPPTL